MNFENIKKIVFFEDGSLRDINVISPMTEISWIKLIIFLENEGTKYTLDHKKHSFSETIEKVGYYFGNITKRDFGVETVTINIFIGNILINGYFMLGKGCILDLDPREVKQEEDFIAVTEFLRKLSNYLEEKINISHENSPELVLYEI